MTKNELINAIEINNEDADIIFSAKVILELDGKMIPYLFVSDISSVTFDNGIIKFKPEKFSFKPESRIKEK